MGERLRVLIVDDEEGIRLGVARVLEKFVASFPDIAAEISYDVESAASGEDAVERLRDSPPDILLLDLKLPGIGGLDVLREARNLEPPVLTVMVKSRPSSRSGTAASSWSRSAMPTASASLKTLSQRTANSSPPNRATVSPGRTAPANRWAIKASSRSPCS